MSAWTHEQVLREYNALRCSYDAHSEHKIRDIAREIVDANAGRPHLGTAMTANGLYFVPVHARGGGYRNIEVRLIPDMEREPALEIAERQIREQWRA